jgi:hypothetical protein
MACSRENFTFTFTQERWWMSREHWWDENAREKPKYSKKKLVLVPLCPQKYYTDWPMIELGTPQCQAGD